jgi:lipopolysaccharide export LptBFGC system permease protein LptF
MKLVGILLIVLGVLLLGSAGISAPRAENASYLIGTFMPGLLCLIVGLILAQKRKPKTPRDEK